MIIMSEESPEPVKPVDWNDEEITKYRIALKRDYISLSNSQAVRLIGLIAGLFTLLQVFQNSKNLPLSDIFLVDIPNIPVLEILANLLPWRLLAFVFSVGLILFFSFRAFFRYALFCALSTNIRWIDKPELNYLFMNDKYLKGKNLMVLLEMATTKKISGDLENFESSYTRRKLYGIFYYDWFLIEKKWGYLLCLILSLLSTWILLGLIW
jgi:hypothetical protein